MTTTFAAGTADIIEKIETRTATIAVIGLGYVGLPLAVALAEAGFRTLGIDLDERKVAGINMGISPVGDVADGRLLTLVATRANQPGEHHRGSLEATADFEALRDVDAVVVCVPTPLSVGKDPDLSCIVRAADEIARRLKPGMLIVLESTSYPGTTEEVVLPRLQNSQYHQLPDPGTTGERLVPGEDFYLAFSPERIDPGRTDWTVRTTPKVIGGVTPACLQVATTLYGSIVDRVVPVSQPRTAEMVKLLENTFRAINIALANEMAMICDRLGIDVWEVIDAAGTKPFGFMPFYPGPGLGGHCIPVDPLYLAWKLRALNFPARSIQLAADINCAMPRFVLGRIADTLNAEGKALKGSRVLVLGVTYKPDVADLRESPVLELLELLASKGADVDFHDPFVAILELKQTPRARVDLTDDDLAGADCVVIATDHSDYDWPRIVRHSRLIFDTRNALRTADSDSTRVVKL